LPLATHVQSLLGGARGRSMSILDTASRPRRPAANWLVYDVLVVCVTALYYGLLAPLGGRNEGGLRWFFRRLRPPPVLPPPVGPRIWIHSVSAGEAKVADLVRTRLIALSSSVSVVLSASTRTGRAKSARAAPAHAFVMPLDTLSLQRRTVRAVQPHVAALSETDFWPAHFAALQEKHIPVVALNATMSTRSTRRHMRLPTVARATVGQAHRIYVQDQLGWERFRRLGVPDERLEICGNLKLATATPRQRALSTETPPTVTFGNVHVPEFLILAPVIARLHSERPTLRIIIVPRYPGPVSALLARAVLGARLTIVRDAAQLARAEPSLILVNSMGQLSDIYAMSSIAVVCGTFVRVGGHDLAEPMHNGAVSIYGPRVERQQELHSCFVAAGISNQVQQASELPGRILALADDQDERAAALTRFAELVARENERLDDICRELLALAAQRFAAENLPRPALSDAARAVAAGTE
jgi:3-deoxy-D-manno-octulosonic-acid transferase